MERYSRQLEVLGIENQKKLLTSTVAILGLGGLGSASSFYLASMGIGKMLLVDKDRIEISNLNRQILYKEDDIGKYKAEVAAQRLKALRSDLAVESYILDVNSPEIESVIQRADVVVDGLDNWTSRLRVNELIVKFGKPFVHAAVGDWYGQLLTVIPGKGPCLHCLFRNVSTERRTISVLPAVPGVMGILQAAEVIKILTGTGGVFYNRILHVDIKNGEFRTISVVKNPFCPICSKISSTNRRL